MPRALAARSLADRFDERVAAATLPLPRPSYGQFTEALTHGTLPWRAPTTRTTLFYKYTPRNEAWSRDEDFFDPQAVRHYADVTARTLAILSPPSSSFVTARQQALEQGAKAGNKFAKNSLAARL